MAHPLEPGCPRFTGLELACYWAELQRATTICARCRRRPMTCGVDVQSGLVEGLLTTSREAHRQGTVGVLDRFDLHAPLDPEMRGRLLHEPIRTCEAT
jgi:hypothetical protein